MTDGWERNFVRNKPMDELTCSMTIEESGEGEVTAAPDKAVIALGFEKEGMALKEIQRETDAAADGLNNLRNA